MTLANDSTVTHCIVPAATARYDHLVANPLLCFRTMTIKKAHHAMHDRSQKSILSFVLVGGAWCKLLFYFFEDERCDAAGDKVKMRLSSTDSSTVASESSDESLKNITGGCVSSLAALVADDTTCFFTDTGILLANLCRSTFVGDLDRRFIGIDDEDDDESLRESEEEAEAEACG